MAEAVNKELYGIGCGCFGEAFNSFTALYALRNYQTFTKVQLEQMLAYAVPKCCDCGDGEVVCAAPYLVLQLTDPEPEILANSVLIIPDAFVLDIDSPDPTVSNTVVIEPDPIELEILYGDIFLTQGPYEVLVIAEPLSIELSINSPTINTE